MTVEYRLGTVEDTAEILALYPLAFPDEDLTDLVRALLPLDEVLSVIATDSGVIIGHAVFTRGTNEAGAALAILGPIGVHPDHQRGGTGKALIAQGAARLKADGVAELLVLGDPDYYSHRGFDAPATVEGPYPIKPQWAQAWRSMLLNASERATGVLKFPAPWMKPELWG